MRRSRASQRMPERHKTNLPALGALLSEPAGAAVGPVSAAPPATLASGLKGPQLRALVAPLDEVGDTLMWSILKLSRWHLVYFV